MEVEVEEKLPPRVKDMRGIRFSRLVVERFAGFYVQPSNGNRTALWQTRCDCGQTATVHGSSLRSGDSTSCGCWQREWSSEVNTKHGHKVGAWGKQGGTPTYRSYSAMIARCENANHNSFPAYGGRPENPVRICEGMRTFEGFISVMGERPEGMSIDRINNDLGYHCGGCGHCEAKGWARNVRWLSLAGQGRNRHTTKLSEAKVTEIRSASGSHHEIARSFGISRGHVSRIKRGQQWADVGSAA
jgi:hypothetical protein